MKNNEQINLKNINDYIVEFDNIIPDYLLDNIFSEYENSSEWTPALTGDRDNNISNNSIRNAYTIPLSIHYDNNTEIRKAIDDELYKCACEAIKKYNEIFPHAIITQDSGYHLLRYQTGQYCNQHIDSFKSRPRTVSCSFILNDGYEGGEFTFFEGKLEFKPKKKSALLFPSNFMYPHEIVPITKGVRYSIITWFT